MLIARDVMIFKQFVSNTKDLIIIDIRAVSSYQLAWTMNIDLELLAFELHIEISCCIILSTYIYVFVFISLLYEEGQG